MKTIVAVLFILACACCLYGEEIKVKLDAETDAERKQMLEKLNENSKDHQMSFVMADTGFEYRIAMDAEPVSGKDFLFGGGADASAAVLTPECELIFAVSRGGRSTKGGAVNALSKEIVKRLKEIRKNKSQS